MHHVFKICHNNLFLVQGLELHNVMGHELMAIHSNKSLQHAISICRANWRTSRDVSLRQGPWKQPLASLFQDAPDLYQFPIPDVDVFPDQYYWDSVAAAMGYLASGEPDLQRRAVETALSLCYLVKKCGLVPNASNSACATRPQPPLLPYLALRVLENPSVFIDADERKAFAYAVRNACKIELSSWKRHMQGGFYRWYDNVPVGSEPEELFNLFRPESRSDGRVIEGILASEGLTLSGDVSFARLRESLLMVLTRWPVSLRGELANWLHSRRVLCATGQDFSACYGEKQLNTALLEKIGTKCRPEDMIASAILEVVPIDLNALMVRYLRDSATIAAITGDHPAAEDLLDESRSLERRTADFFWAAGVLKHRYEDQSPANAFSHLSEVLYPLWSGLVSVQSTISEATCHAMSDLITDYGIAMSHYCSGFQWDYNMWPLQVMLSIEALDQVGRRQDALRIAHGYLKTLDRCYELHGSFFEKYNPHDGSTNTIGRYPAAADFTWGAASYLWVGAFVER
jgi:neutral trehalase